jgi:dTDP-4-amino-4,6-dideoxygalactose transaminase
MRVPFLDIKAQYTELAPQIDEVVHDVISSGSYMMGSHHNALEKEIADLHGCRFGIALNSGTDALRIMLDAAGIGPGDEVITTAFTFVASVETIVQTGAVPVFVEIDPDTLMIEPSVIAKAITSKTKAIMPIHLFGQLCAIEDVNKIADEYGLTIIEDAAQAIGNHRNGEYAGAFGIAAGFSFYVTKNLGAAGDAGLILTNDDDMCERCRAIRVHGMARERYYYDYVGYTSRMDEVQAAVLRVKLTRLEAWNEARNRHAKTYLDRLSNSGLKMPVTSPGNYNTWHQFTIQHPRRNELMQFLKTREIDSMIYYPVPLHFHQPYSRFGSGKGSLPVTERVCEEVLSLPIHQHLSDDQATWVADSILEFCSSSL